MINDKGRGRGKCQVAVTEKHMQTLAFALREVTFRPVGRGECLSVYLGIRVEGRIPPWCFQSSVTFGGPAGIKGGLDAKSGSI
jgi:hypothetical protein